MDPKIRETSTHLEIGVKVDQFFRISLQEIITSKGKFKNIDKSTFVDNIWFWKTLFFSKGCDLINDRGGLVIVLNQLDPFVVEDLSKLLNKRYSFHSTIRFRKLETLEKPSLYIPTTDRVKFLNWIGFEFK